MSTMSDTSLLLRRERSESRFRLAVDIGGTFTDAVLFDEESGEVTRDKILTTADDPSIGFLQCVDRLIARLGFDAAQLAFIVHGTTIATNALLERRGARVALLTTEGFRDVVEIGRQIRHELYDFQFDKPPPLVRRENCIGIPERVSHTGEILKPLDEDAVAAAVDLFRNAEIESVAICFLHAYRNPAHELRAAEIIRKKMPGVEISVSSEIAPEIREYWRASTAVTNAYVAPPVTRYLTRVASKLADGGVTVSPHVMQSSGGLMTLDQAKHRPVFLLESGPAAGVLAASFFAGHCGLKNAIAFDMGGTTAKMGVIENGSPRIVSDFEAGGIHGSGSGVSPGSGYPILAPSVDLVEVGAGGGSIAWRDAGGLMRVGPQSAGSHPGPVCYGLGGTEPTLTDANLILGRLSPDFFLGGEMTLDVTAARQSIEKRLATPFGMSITEAALGMLDIAKSTMAEAIRLVTVQRGMDPRDFTLVVTGGAGPAFANLLADDLQFPLVLVPPSPGTASALGMLVSEIGREARITHIGCIDHANPADANTVIAQLEERVRAALTSDNVSADAMSVSGYVEMRYVGQSWSIPLVLPNLEVSSDDLITLRTAFDHEHERLYGYAVPDDRVEIVNFGVRGIGRIPMPQMKDLPRGDHDGGHALKKRRPVVFRKHEEELCPVYDRRALLVGNVIAGPAILEEVDSSTIILPGYHGEVVAYGALQIKPLI